MTAAAWAGLVLGLEALVIVALVLVAWAGRNTERDEDGDDGGPDDWPAPSADASSPELEPEVVYPVVAREPLWQPAPSPIWDAWAGPVLIGGVLGLLMLPGLAWWGLCSGAGVLSRLVS